MMNPSKGFGLKNFKGNAAEGEGFGGFGMQTMGSISALLAELKACRKSGDLDRVKLLHAAAAERGCEKNVFVASALVDVFARCGSMGHARTVFDSAVHRNVVTWNALLFGYVENGEGEATLDLLASMALEGCIPTARTLLAAVKAATSVSFQKGMAIHAQAEASSCIRDPFLASALVDMYCKRGSVARARRLFDHMSQHDVVSCSALIMGYAANGMGKEALSVFASMFSEARNIQPNAVAFAAALKACGAAAALQQGRAIHAQVARLGLDQQPLVASCLVDFYGRCTMVDAQRYFDSLPLASTSVVLWTCLIAGYSRQGDSQSVFNAFHKMVNLVDIEPNGVTFLCVLAACRHAGLVGAARQYFDAMTRYGVQPQVEHYSVMAGVLGDANQLKEALDLVRSMPFKPDAATWTTVLDSCRRWKNLQVGCLAFDSLLLLNDKDPNDVYTAHTLMADIRGL